MNGLKNYYKLYLKAKENIVYGVFLCPYLINVKKTPHEESFSILKDWLEKCSQLRKLDFSINSELRNRLKNVNQFKPISGNKLIEENKQLFEIINSS